MLPVTLSPAYSECLQLRTRAAVLWATEGEIAGLELRPAPRARSTGSLTALGLVLCILQV